MLDETGVKSISQGPAREETPLPESWLWAREEAFRTGVYEQLDLDVHNLLRGVPETSVFADSIRLSRLSRIVLAYADAGAQSRTPPNLESRTVAPQLELLQELAALVNGYVGSHGCPADAPCGRCVWANEVMGRLAAALPATPEFSSEELEHCKQIAASLTIVEHPRTFPEAVFSLFDDLLVLAYDVQGKWRVQVETADGTKATISLNSTTSGKLARVQIRGIALELLGHYWKTLPAASVPAASSQKTVGNVT